MNKRIKSLRKALGLTQQELADKLNIKRGAIANYEIGRNDPIDAVISLICKEFNVNESWLRTGEGDMFRHLPETDEVAEYIEELLMDTEDSVYKAIRAFMKTYGRLDDTSKEIMRRAVSDWVDNINKEQD